MSVETLSLVVDLTFSLVGIALVVVQLARRREAPAVESPPPSTWPEFLLTAGGLAAAAVGPNILVVALTPGMPEMPVLTRYALVPSLALLVFVWGAAAWRNYGRLTNRIWTGIWIGAAATGVLDAIRLTGFHLGQMPGNMPRMFGVLILDRMALGPTLGSDVLGYLYHYWVGACFGLTYTLLAGRFPWWGGLVWGLIVELGMMVTPPMVVAMDTGYFGSKFGAGLLVTSLIAHVAFGVALGLLAERYVRHQGSIFGVLRGCFRRADVTGPAAANSSVLDVAPGAEAAPIVRAGPFWKRHLDKVGLGGSLFAALCCLGFPAALAVVSALGLGFLINDAVLLPLLLVFLAVLLGGLWLGRRHHGSFLPLVVAGMSAVATWAFLFVRYSRPLAWVGIGGLAAASLLNIILLQRQPSSGRTSRGRS